tara:strand:- start:211 stop:801 length:591 start_codon:yes stop_codon:yes gene_type:complete
MALRLSKLEKALLAAVGADVIKPGTSRKALTAAARGLGRVALTTAPAAPAVARAGVGGLAGFAARRPRTAAALAGLGAQQLGVFDPIQEAIEMEVDRRIMDPLRNVRDIPENIQRATETPVFRPAVKRKVSKYSKAVKSAMAAVKASKFNGKKGKISNAKTTFAKVNKVASAVNKGKKVSAKGVTGVIKRAVSKYL